VVDRGEGCLQICERCSVLFIIISGTDAAGDVDVGLPAFGKQGRIDCVGFVIIPGAGRKKDERKCENECCDLHKSV
jgi:hypothetical protein